jgi:hypothetical protein
LFSYVKRDEGESGFFNPEQVPSQKNLRTGNFPSSYGEIDEKHNPWESDAKKRKL